MEAFWRRRERSAVGAELSSASAAVFNACNRHPRDNEAAGADPDVSTGIRVKRRQSSWSGVSMPRPAIRSVALWARPRQGSRCARPASRASALTRPPRRVMWLLRRPSGSHHGHDGVSADEQDTAATEKKTRARYIAITPVIMSYST
jgi:hypothetical protein